MFAALNSFLTRAVTGYFLNKSLRFRSSASAYLNRTPATTTNQKTWTWSAWVKRGALVDGTLFEAEQSGPVQLLLKFFSNNLIVVRYAATGTNFGFDTNAVFRDPAAWYHIVLAFDTTQVTAADRLKLYVNGAQQAGVTRSGYPSASPDYNTNYAVNASTLHTLANATDGPNYFDGEMAEINFVDGQALAPTSFGASSIYNQWLPIKYAGTYGTNGFYLPFSGGTATSYAGSFNGSSQYLSVAANTAFDFGTGDFTVECWVYPIANGLNYPTFLASVTGWSTGASAHRYNVLGNANKFWFGLNGASGVSGGDPFLVSNNTFPSNAWYHYALTRSGNTFRMFVNGALENTQTFTGSYDAGLGGLRSGLGTWDGAQGYFTGNVSNLRMVKGTAVYTAAFIPPTTALTAITNTSLLTLQNATIVDNSTNAFTITNNGTVVTSVQSPFLNPTVLTADSSGNGNNWTPNNISLTAGSTYDSLTDVPTLTSETVANYAVLNPLYKGSQQTISNGNLTSSKAVGTTISDLWGNFGMTSGKWYFECSVTALAGTLYIGVGQGGGIGEPLDDLAVSPTSYFYTSFNGDKNYGGTSAAYGNSYTVGDVIGCAVDMTNGKIWWSKNGTWQASGDPAAGTNAAYTDLLTRGSNAFLVYSAQNAVNNSNTLNWNFGQQPFVYTAPSGFLPLNTFNIAAGTVTTSGTFTGNASTDGPMVWLNGTPTAMTINGNAVTFGTQADKLANGFKVRSSSASYNASGSNTYVATTVGEVFKYEEAQANP
jgi:hypothetical protein